MMNPVIWIVRVVVWDLVNPLRVLLLSIVSVYVPTRVLAVVVMVRVDIPEPPDTVDELYAAPMPADKVVVGIVRSSFTRVLKLPFGLIVTVTG
jgi:hypothetical protein